MQHIAEYSTKGDMKMALKISGTTVIDNSRNITNINAITETAYSLTGTAIDPSNGTIQYKTLTANTTLTETLADGQSVLLMVNPATFAVTWPTITWANGTAPTLTASKFNTIVLWQVSGVVYGALIGPMG